MREIGDKRWAKTFIKVSADLVIYTENSIDYIREQLALTEQRSIWIDTATIINDDVYFINKKDVIEFGEV